jgi:hypothetical protein
MLPALAVLLIGTMARAAPVKTYDLEADDCRDGTLHFGTGFVVPSLGIGPPQPGKLLLVTSLHVVHGCSSLTVIEVTCPPDGEPSRKIVAGFSEGTALLVVPEYDLAAVPFKPTAGSAASFSQGQGELQWSAPAPQIDEQLAVIGTGELASCPSGWGTAGGTPTAAFMMQHLRARVPALENATDAVLLGSMKPDLRLLTYFSTARPGVSGAPVTRLGDHRVLAIHQGGAADFPSGWGVRIAPRSGALPTPLPAKLGRASWPAYRPPMMAQAAHLREVPLGGEAKQLAERSAATQVLIGAEIGGEYPLLRSSLLGEREQLFKFGEWVGSVRASAFFELNRPEGTKAPDDSWGLGVAAGLLRGRTFETYLPPVGDEPLEQMPTGYWAPTLSGLAEYRFGRLTSVRWGVEAAPRFELWALDEASCCELGLALPLTLRAGFRVEGSYHTITVHLRAIPQLQPVAAHRYAGIGAGVESVGLEPALSVGAGLGWEY